MVTAGKNQILDARDFSDAIAPHRNEFVASQWPVFAPVKLGENQAASIAGRKYNQMIDRVVRTRVFLEKLIVNIEYDLFYSRQRRIPDCWRSAVLHRHLDADEVTWYFRKQHDTCQAAFHYTCCDH